MKFRNLVLIMANIEALFVCLWLGLLISSFNIDNLIAVVEAFIISGLLFYIHGLLIDAENKEKEKTNVKLTKEEVNQILNGKIIEGSRVNVGMVVE